MVTQALLGSLAGGPLRSMTRYHKRPELVLEPNLKEPPWQCESGVTLAHINNLNVGDSGLTSLRRAIKQVSFELAVAVLRGAELFLLGHTSPLTAVELATCFLHLPQNADQLADGGNHESLMQLISSTPTNETVYASLRWIRTNGEQVPIRWTHATPTLMEKGWRCLGWVEGTHILAQTTASSSLLAMIACIPQIHFAILTMINNRERICFPFEDTPLTNDLFERIFGFAEARSLTNITSGK